MAGRRALRDIKVECKQNSANTPVNRYKVNEKTCKERIVRMHKVGVQVNFEEETAQQTTEAQLAFGIKWTPQAKAEEEPLARS